MAPVAAADRKTVLQLLLGNLPPHERECEVATILAARPAPAWDGLFGCRRGHRSGEPLAAAAWGLRRPGRTVTVWPPGVARGLTDADASAAAAALLDAITAYARRHGDRLLQAILDPDDTAAAALVAAGYRRLTDLLYLIRDAGDVPAPRPELSFVRYHESRHTEWGRLLVDTYVGSRDCPELNGVRSPEDVLAGHRAGGPVDARRWLRAELAGRPAGVLLTGLLPELDALEIVYLGVLPDHRRRGLGRELLREAVRLAGRSGVARVSLAVDCRNEPALRLYDALGFTAWNRRHAFVRLPGR